MNLIKKQRHKKKFLFQTMQLQITLNNFMNKFKAILDLNNKNKKLINKSENI